MNLKQHKTGFTLIEIVVALLIGSLLTVSLYQILQTVQRSVLRINSIVDINTPVIGFYNQWQRDIIGIFTPRNIAGEKKSEAKEQANKTEKEKTGKQEQKKIENIFVCTGEGLNFSCNFITTGGIKLISSTGDYIPAPYNKRVVYALEPDKSRPGLYILTYGQTDDLDVSNVKTVARYELMRNIKKFEASFKIYEPVQKKAQTQDKKAESKPKLISSSRFVSKEMFKKYKSHIPAFIEIKGSYIDPRIGQEFFFKYILEVPSYSLPESKKEETSSGESVAEKAETSAAPAGQKPATARTSGPVPASKESANIVPAQAPTSGTITMNKQTTTQNSLAGFVP